MSTMTKAGIPVDTGFAKRQHEHAERKARQVAFNNKVREFHATDRGVKVTKKKNDFVCRDVQQAFALVDCDTVRTASRTSRVRGTRVQASSCMVRKD